MESEEREKDGEKVSSLDNCHVDVHETTSVDEWTNYSRAGR